MKPLPLPELQKNLQTSNIICGKGAGAVELGSRGFKLHIAWPILEIIAFNPITFEISAWKEHNSKEILLLPNKIYLRGTQEFVGSPHFIMGLETEKSYLLKGLKIHYSSFLGNKLKNPMAWTLELGVLVPLKIKEGEYVGNHFFYDNKIIEDVVYAGGYITKYVQLPPAFKK
jgi:hypothetical protein